MTDTTRAPFCRQVIPGWIPGNGNRRHRYFVDIEYGWRNRGMELSITAVLGPDRHGNAWGGCGQYTGPLTDPALVLAPGWTRATVARLAEVWSRWHLNGMRAECEHQRALGWTYQTHAGQDCPECGYRIGSAWLREDVPADVLDWLRALPEADRVSPWGLPSRCEPPPADAAGPDA